MSDYNYDTVEDLFIRCLEKEDSKQQRKWLQKQCKDQPELFDEVVSLLQAHSDSDEFLEEPIKFETLSIDEQSEFKRQRDSKYIGETIGVYQIDSLLGRGGMGSVYLAHRNDGEYEQEVAIKVVESSNLESMLFRRERQILAQLNHPNIVTLLDGGTLPDGGSYFVMERVDGLNIDEHIKQKKLDSRQVLALIIKLGLVIQEAHQHGIIHCDIKPANILVTDDGVLKLLDFGIAQHLSQPDSSAKQIKSAAPKRFALTPEYSSPRRHQQYVPVISDDVFSLGVLLAHALSGKVPAVIVSDFAPFPEPDIEKTAEYISDFELKQVFLKATHPVEKQRYASAKSLVNDLQSWLGNYPVSAVGKGGYYALKKHVWRNWRYWGIASALLISLLVASSIWVHKQQLERESLQVQKITKDMLLDLDSTLETLPHTTLIRKKLIETANRRVEQFSQQAPNNLAIKKMRADTLERLAEVTGHPYALNQGNIDGALAYYQQALEIYQSLLDQQKGSISGEVDVANTQRKIAEIKGYQGDIDGGLQIMKEVRIHMESVFADIPIEQQLPMLILYTVEAHGHFHKGNLKKAEELIEKAWEIAHANKQEHPKYFLILAFLHEETGHLALLTNREENAKQEYLAVIEKYQDNNLWQHKRRLARVHNGLACIALKNDNIMAVQHHFQQTWEAFSELNEKYPKVNSIQDKLNNLNLVYENIEPMDSPNVQTLALVLHCDNPLAFMIPPQK